MFGRWRRTREPASSPASIPKAFYHSCVWDSEVTILGVHRSVRLLWDYLSPEQRNSMAQDGCIWVPSRMNPGYAYKIGNRHLHPRTTTLVSLWHNCATKELVYNFCITPDKVSMPYPDLILAHLWSLQADEYRWRKTANTV